MKMTQADFMRQKAEARATLAQLAKLYPGCFDAQGRPIVATLRLPSQPTGTQERST